MIIARAKRGRTFRERCWYERDRKGNLRRYHVFGLCRLVTASSSCWRLIIGPWVIAFRFKESA
jgi:hypothetical protein